METVDATGKALKVRSLLVREINWMETDSTPSGKATSDSSRSLLAREINWLETAQLSSRQLTENCYLPTR